MILYVFYKRIIYRFIFFGLFSSMLLILCGNDKHKNINKVIGLYVMYVSLMQLIDYFIWSDLNCTHGLNQLSYYMGPILNHLQPIVLLLLCNIYLKSHIKKSFIYTINIVYLVYVIERYYNYIQTYKCIHTNEDNHLDWPWKYNFDYKYYLIIQIINAMNYTHSFIWLITFIMGYILLIISTFKFTKNVGELWCFMTPAIPLFVLGLQL